MSDELDDLELETGDETETDEGASVSGKSESELEGRTAAEGDEAEGKERAANDKGDPKQAPEWYRKRIAKLTATRNRERAEAAADRARLAAYEKAERDAEKARRAAEAATPEARTREAKRQAVRETIDDAYGPGTSRYLETRQEAEAREQEERDRAAEAYTSQGVSYLRKEIEDHGLVADDAALVRWDHWIGSELAEDPELLAMYRRPATQQKAIELAFERARDGLLNPVLKSSGAREIARIERNRSAVLGGGKNMGAVAQADEPTFDLKPPKELKGRALEEWWDVAKQKYWKTLQNSDTHA